MIGVIRTGYTLKVKNFEGPLELLLELIQEAKLEITDISLSTITDQYLMYIKTVQLFNIDITSEFFVIAAGLVYLKTRKLLPNMKSDDEDMLDEKELIERLKEYRKFRYLSRLLWQIKEEGGVYFSRGFHRNPLGTGKSVQVEAILMGDLVRVLGRYRGSFIKKPIPIKRREVNVEQKMTFILNMLNARKLVRFSEVVESDATKIDRVASFLGSLELSFRQKVLLEQLRLFMDISIIKREEMLL